MSTTPSSQQAEDSTGRVIAHCEKALKLLKEKKKLEAERIQVRFRLNDLEREIKRAADRLNALGLPFDLPSGVQKKKRAEPNPGTINAKVLDLLKVKEGRTFKEVADLMGCTEEMAQARVYRLKHAYPNLMSRISKGVYTTHIEDESARVVVPASDVVPAIVTMKAPVMHKPEALVIESSAPSKKTQNSSVDSFDPPTERERILEAVASWGWASLEDLAADLTLPLEEIKSHIDDLGLASKVSGRNVLYGLPGKASHRR